MLKRYLLLIILLSLAACGRLDEDLYDADDSINEYRFDAYAGKVDFELDASYDIAPENIHLLELSSNDNGDLATIYAVYVGELSRIATDTVILYAHGNRHHMDSYWPRVKLLAHISGKHGVGVMTLDYRGYGLSGGKTTESGLNADVDTALQWLQLNGLSADRLVMYGFSMGTAPATKLTARPRTMIPAKLILEAPFASSEVMLQDATQLALPDSYVTDLKIDNAEQIKKVTQPFLWLHGTDDVSVNIKTHGEPVFRNYGGNAEDKTALRIRGAGHSNVPEVMGFTEYISQLEGFIN